MLGEWGRCPGKGADSGMGRGGVGGEPQGENHTAHSVVLLVKQETKTLISSFLQHVSIGYCCMPGSVLGTREARRLSPYL